MKGIAGEKGFPGLPGRLIRRNYREGAGESDDGIGEPGLTGAPGERGRSG